MHEFISSLEGSFEFFWLVIISDWIIMIKFMIAATIVGIGIGIGIVIVISGGQ